MSGALLDLYRKDRGVSASVAPKVDLKVQVSGDGQPERVLLIGRDIVVFGPGFKGGTAYAYLTLQQFSSEGDITDLSARDLTGDGAADLVVRGTRHVKSDSGTVDEETIFAYQVTGDTITRIFGIETGREMGSKRIQGMVQFIPRRAASRSTSSRPPDARRVGRRRPTPGRRTSRAAGRGAAALALGRDSQRAVHVERQRVRAERRLGRRLENLGRRVEGRGCRPENRPRRAC